MDQNRIDAWLRAARTRWSPFDHFLRRCPKRRLIVAPSRYQTLAGGDIGYGLHLLQGVSPNSLIAEYVGEETTLEEARALFRAGAPDADFMVMFSDDQSVLNCYAHHLDFRCWASWINSPVGLRDDPAQRPSQWPVIPTYETVANSYNFFRA